MRSFVKKVLFGCLLIMVCGFVISARSSATSSKKHDARAGTTCEMQEIDSSSESSADEVTGKSISVDSSASKSSESISDSDEASEAESKTVSSKESDARKGKRKIPVVESSTEGSDRQLSESSRRQNSASSDGSLKVTIKVEEGSSASGGVLSPVSVERRKSELLPRVILGTPKAKKPHERSLSKIDETKGTETAVRSRKSSLLFSTLQLNIPENILRDAEGVIENPIRRRDVKLKVLAPTMVSTTPGTFGIKVMIDNQLEREIDDVSIYVQFEDDSPELSFVPPVPVVKDVKLVDADQYLYNVQVGRVHENVNRGFIVYATHKAEDKTGEEREYLIAAHKQQVSLKESPPNKAVIIVPGICGSELFSAKAQVIDGVQYSKGYRVWPPEGVAAVMEDGVPCCTSTRAKKKFVERLWQDVKLIACTESGKSQAKIMIANPVMDCKSNPDRRNFGTINCYGGLVESIIKSDYAAEAKVIFFSYDWRVGNKKVADALAQFIDDNDLTEVTLVSHSMGGLVCSSLLSDPANCTKISKVIFLGSPFLGAAKAYNVLENGMFFDGIIGDVTGPVANPAISLLAKNWRSVYELLPPRQLFDIMRGPSCKSDVLDRGYLYTRKSKSNPLTSNYALRSYPETVAIIRSRGWTPKVDTFVKRAQKFHDSLYDVDGEMKFLKNGVPIYNVVGVDTLTHSGYFLTYRSDGRVSCKEDLDNGDGTVTLISSTLFGNIPDANTYYVQGVDHMGLMQNAKCLQLINYIIDGHDERFDPTVIGKHYPERMSSEGCGCFPLCICF